MSDGVAQEAPRPSVNERVKAVLGTLRRSPDLVTYPLAGGGGAAAGLGLALSAQAEHPVAAAVIGLAVGAAGGLAAHTGIGNMRADSAVNEANSWSDPGPVVTGKSGMYKDLVTAWRTGEPQGAHYNYYYKDNPSEHGGQYYSDKDKTE